MIYYEIKEDGHIGRFTPCEAVAKDLGLSLETEKEIVCGYDGKYYFAGEEPTPPEPSYSEKRASEYPSIQDQLDMIYWDKVNGSNKWVEKISEIKAKYPKA